MSLKQNYKAGKSFLKNTRNVLAPPKNTFWPVLGNDDFKFIKNLEASLRCAKTFHPKIQWSEFRKLSKNERNSKIEKLIQNLPPDELEAHKKGRRLRKSLSLGVNDVSRSLEKDELVCCLICGEAKPKLLLMHLIELAKSKKIPILVLNSLKDNVKSSLGFSSLAVGFKKEILLDPSHDFYSLCNEMLELFNEKFSYDLQKKYIEHEFPKVNFEPNTLFVVTPGKKVISSQAELTLNDIYLFRESNNYRVFKPDGDSENVTANNGQSENGEVEIAVDSEEAEGVVNKKARYYKPPTVFKVQSNPNKIRKKKRKT